MQATKRIKDPRKQRKMLHNAPAHLRHKLMAASLSPQLAASKSVKTLPVRKGDTVRIMRGDNKGFEGKISRVDLKNYRIYLEGLTREKVDGTAIFLPVHPSKVMIKNLNLSDKWRKAIVDRKEALHKEAAKAEKAVEKPLAKMEKAEKVVVKEVAEEKPVKVKEKAAVEEKPAKAQPKAKPAKAPTKARKKPASEKKQKPAPTEEEKLTEKEKKPKATKTAKKTRAKRKTASEEKEGGK